MAIYNNVNGTIFETNHKYENVNGTIVEVNAKYQNVNGVIRQTYEKTDGEPYVMRNGKLTKYGNPVIEGLDGGSYITISSPERIIRPDGRNGQGIRVKYETTDTHYSYVARYKLSVSGLTSMKRFNIKGYIYKNTYIADAFVHIIKGTNEILYQKNLLANQNYAEYFTCSGGSSTSSSGNGNITVEVLSDQLDGSDGSDGSQFNCANFYIGLIDVYLS